MIKEIKNELYNTLIQRYGVIKEDIKNSYVVSQMILALLRDSLMASSYVRSFGINTANHSLLGYQILGTTQESELFHLTLYIEKNPLKISIVEKPFHMKKYPERDKIKAYDYAMKGVI